MNDKYLNLKEEAKRCLAEMHIEDGDAFINNLLFELGETDERNLELKLQILDDIKKFLRIG